MYPEPEVCLNLPAWKEFCGFDKEGQNAWFDIDLDEETGEAVFRRAEDRPFGFRGEAERINLVFDPEKVQKVKAAPMIPGEDRETALPGPWAQWDIAPLK